MIVELAVLSLALGRNGTASEYVHRSQRDDATSASELTGEFLGEFAKAGSTVTSTTVFSPVEHRFGNGIRGVLAAAKYRDVADLASQVVAAMAATALTNGDADIPPLVASEDHDGTIFVEWIFSDRRVGLTFDRDPSQSGWHFLVGSGDSVRVERGPMSELEPSVLAKKALKS